MVCLPSGTGVRAALDTACTKAGYEPLIVFEASALPMVAHLAGLGLGIAILPASTAESHPALHVVQIGRPPIRSRLELVWDCAAATSPAARVLIEHTRAFIGGVAANGRPAL